MPRRRFAMIVRKLTMLVHVVLMGNNGVWALILMTNGLMKVNNGWGIGGVLLPMIWG